uniref:Uncharacterized protein n=1 Tax=Rangifer tarandus platyrhynchus TaxID=3082113 RepID=A0ACB0E4H1_RANTA|nr:unnamed protein product [Rangifer tarandus platyrhynchus]
MCRWPPGAQLQGVVSNTQGLSGLLPRPTSASGTSGPGRQVAEAQWGACPGGGCSENQASLPAPPRGAWHSGRSALTCFSASSGAPCSHPHWLPLPVISASTPAALWGPGVRAREVGAMEEHVPGQGGVPSPRTPHPACQRVLLDPYLAVGSSVPPSMSACGQLGSVAPAAPRRCVVG